MSTTHPSNPERGRPGFSLRRHIRAQPLLASIFAVMAGLTLLLASWGVVSANTLSDEPPTEESVSYEACVAAAVESFGSTESASNAPSSKLADARRDPGKRDSGKTGSTPETAEPQEVHPNSPFHDWCTADCDADEQCARPSEFRIAEEPDTEMVSISKAELEANQN